MNSDGGVHYYLLIWIPRMDEFTSIVLSLISFNVARTDWLRDSFCVRFCASNGWTKTFAVFKSTRVRRNNFFYVQWKVFTEVEIPYDRSIIFFFKAWNVFIRQTFEYQTPGFGFVAGLWSTKSENLRLANCTDNKKVFEKKRNLIARSNVLIDCYVEFFIWVLPASRGFDFNVWYRR